MKASLLGSTTFDCSDAIDGFYRQKVDAETGLQRFVRPEKTPGIVFGLENIMEALGKSAGSAAGALFRGPGMLVVAVNPCL